MSTAVKKGKKPSPTKDDKIREALKGYSPTTTGLLLKELGDKLATKLSRDDLGRKRNIVQARALEKDAAAKAAAAAQSMAKSAQSMAQSAEEIKDAVNQISPNTKANLEAEQKLKEMMSKGQPIRQPLRLTYVRNSPRRTLLSSKSDLPQLQFPSRIFHRPEEEEEEFQGVSTMFRTPSPHESIVVGSPKKLGQLLEQGLGSAAPSSESELESEPESVAVLKGNLQNILSGDAKKADDKGFSNSLVISAFVFAAFLFVAVWAAWPDNWSFTTTQIDANGQSVTSLNILKLVFAIILPIVGFLIALYTNLFDM